VKENILIIDDDKKLNALLSEYLQKSGFQVASAVDPQSGMKALRTTNPELIILDIMLPEKDGFEVCKEIRQEYSVPIIMLTARGDVTDRIVGLEMGADDYLPKPFEPRELLARIQSVLRRSNKIEKKEIITCRDLSVDLKRQTMTLYGKPREITTTEFKILALLIKHPGRVYSRDTLVDTLRGIEWEAYDRSVDVLISRLRQKLDDHPKNPRFIKTVHGTGYSFIGVEEDE
jgi:DNA-binding response OmpR family regulator